MNPADCLKTRPKIVAVIGLGVSRLAYGEQICVDGCNTPWQEVWTVNFGGHFLRHDKLWVMDDLRAQAKRIESYGDMLRRHPAPIITSTAYPEYPQSVRFPIEAVVAALGDDFLNSTVAYAIAYALTTGVKELWLFGCDFHYPNQTRAEEGGQCAAYLLGLGRHFGMTFKLPQQTTLLGCYHGVIVGNSVRRPLYGYAKQPFIPEVQDVAQPGQSPRDGEDPGHDRVPAGAGPPHSQPEAGQRAADLDSGRGNLLRERGAGLESARLVLGGLPQDDARAPTAVGPPVAGGGSSPGADGDDPTSPAGTQKIETGSQADRG